MPQQTGPLTTAGKSASSMNSLKHSGTSMTLFLKDEDPAEFFLLLEDAFEQYQPSFHQDAILVSDCTRARWILSRRLRLAEAFEASVVDLKVNIRSWLPNDLDDLQRWDRYVTQARRAHSAYLKDVQSIKKAARDDQRWQQHLVTQKQSFALDVQRFELAKERETRLAAKKQKATPAEIIAEAAATHDDVQVDEHGPYIAQAVYVAVEDGITQVFDTVPSNAEVRRLIATADRLPTPPVEVVRTYVFAGLIPPEYQWLITEDWERHIENLELRKTLSFEEWTNLITTE